jgi:hypothetical protein
MRKADKKEKRKKRTFRFQNAPKSSRRRTKENAARFALRRADSSSIDTPRDIRSTHRSRHTLHHYTTII